MVRLAEGAQYRHSKRGLVLAGPGGDTVLFEHPLADTLPELLTADPATDRLCEQLGPPLSPTLVDDLLDLGVLSDGSPSAERVDQRHRFSRSGIAIYGVARPAQWIERVVVPLILSVPGMIVIAAVLVGGAVALVGGRPDLPAVSGTPALEALLMLAIGMTATICHELAHAVALVHYGVTPRRAGFGFYWGAISFFVDSTPAMTLGRRERVTQALVGLAVDCVSTAVLAIGAHLLAHSSELVALVMWRLAILSLAEIVLNLLPVLQVDGHWALADFLDEPDLAPRARRTLGLALRRRLPSDQRWLAAYGAFSLTAGIGMLAALVSVFWYAAGDLVVALFAGNVTDIAIGIYYVAPITLGVLFSGVGLILETIQTDDPTR